MGSCGSNVVDQLGPQFGKYIAVEKGKLFIDQKVREMKDNVSRQTAEIQQETLARINSQQNNSLERVRMTVADIDRQSPGTLDQAASLQRKTKQSLLGADEVRNKFGQLSRTAQNTFQDQKQKIFNEIDNVSQLQKRNLDAQRPSIPLYDQLPSGQKKKAFEQAEKKFAEQIRNQQEIVQQEFDRTVNMSKYTDILRNAQSTIPLDQVSGQVDSIISHAKGGLSTTALFC